MTTTELDTTIAEVEATLSALEQTHARQVRALQQELAALTAQRCAALLATAGPPHPQPPQRPIPDVVRDTLPRSLGRWPAP
jgi:uncharacterized coiled-coil protein SlyX